MIGIVVVAVLLVVGVGAFFFYKKYTRAVPSYLSESGADSVEMYKKQWKDNSAVINNPSE